MLLSTPYFAPIFLGFTQITEKPDSPSRAQNEQHEFEDDGHVLCS
jgi:hypothetical protein